MIFSSRWGTKKISEHGIVILRLWLGIIMIKHSYPVVLNNGFAEFGDWLKSMNIPMPYIMAYLAKCGEFFGGIMLALGFLTRIGALLILINMIVAVSVVSHFTIFSEAELAFDYLLIALTIFLFGPGQLSIDYFISNKRNTGSSLNANAQID